MEAWLSLNVGWKTVAETGSSIIFLGVNAPKKDHLMPSDIIVCMSTHQVWSPGHGLLLLVRGVVVLPHGALHPVHGAGRLIFRSPDSCLLSVAPPITDRDSPATLTSPGTLSPPGQVPRVLCTLYTHQAESKRKGKENELKLRHSY